MPKLSTTVEKDSSRDSLIATALAHAAAGIERAAETAEEAAEAARSAAEAADAAEVDDWAIDLEEAAEHLQGAADLLTAVAFELDWFDPAQHAALAAIAEELANMDRGGDRKSEDFKVQNCTLKKQLSIDQAATLSNPTHVPDLPAHQPTRSKRPQRLPPYARRIVDARRSGDHPERILIATGANAWKRAAAAAEPLAILPEGEDPQAFLWTFVRGLPCQIVQTAPCNAERMDQLAVALVQAGSPRVELLSPEGDDADIYLPREAP